MAAFDMNDPEAVVSPGGVGKSMVENWNKVVDFL